MHLTVDDVHAWLDQASDEELDRLPYGVVGMDREGRTRRYNQYEVTQAGFQPDQVIGRPFFHDIARCMDNGLVAGRFAQAVATHTALDAMIDYVIAFRSTRVKARMRLLFKPDSPTSYLLVERLAESGA